MDVLKDRNAEFTITSTWSQSAPCLSSGSADSARRAKSADRMDGLIMVAGRSRPGDATGSGRLDGIPACPCWLSADGSTAFCPPYGLPWCTARKHRAKSLDG